jgi:hypothetical protein
MSIDYVNKICTNMYFKSNNINIVLYFILKSRINFDLGEIFQISSFVLKITYFYM